MKLILTDEEGTVIDMWTIVDDPEILIGLADEVLNKHDPTAMYIRTAYEALDKWRRRAFVWMILDIPDTAISGEKVT